MHGRHRMPIYLCCASARPTSNTSIASPSDTRQVYHFGETGRGWQTRGAEWRRKLAKEYSLETEVVPLRSGLLGKAAAKQLETRYIDTYEKAFGQKPFYINENGEV